MIRQIICICCCLIITLTEARGNEKSKLLAKRVNTADMCLLNTPLFTCDDGDCILRSWYCDGGDPDCEDGSDESNCKDNVCDPRLVIPCGDGTCRPLSYTCNGENDCPPGADGFAADEMDCPDNMDLVCDDGEIVKEGLAGRCDAYPDCSDKSDEDVESCKAYTCNPTIQITCSIDNSCRPIYYRCDGERDCDDGEDEVDCDYASY